MDLQITATSPEHPAALLDLPWSLPLEEWPDKCLVSLPGEGCYPEGPWVGLATLGLYAAVALGLAVWRLRRRDA